MVTRFIIARNLFRTASIHKFHLEKFTEMSFFNFYKEYTIECCNNSHGLTENENAIEVIKGNINFVAGNHLCHKLFYEEKSNKL